MEGICCLQDIVPAAPSVSTPIFLFSFSWLSLIALGKAALLLLKGGLSLTTLCDAPAMFPHAITKQNTSKTSPYLVHGISAIILSTGFEFEYVIIFPYLLRILSFPQHIVNVISHCLVLVTVFCVGLFSCRVWDKFSWLLRGSLKRSERSRTVQWKELRTKTLVGF